MDAHVDVDLSLRICATTWTPSPVVYSTDPDSEQYHFLRFLYSQFNLNKCLVSFFHPTQKMAFEYQQLNEEYSLQYSPTPPPSYPQASLAPCFPSLPSRGRQSSLPELSQLTYSFPANNTNPYPQPPSYRFPESNHTTADNSCTDTSRNPKVQSHTNIAHPYARLYAKNDSKKRHRKIWNHTLEKALFNSHELYVA